MNSLIDQSVSLQQKVDKLLQKLFELQAENIALRSHIEKLEQIEKINAGRVENALAQVNQILASISLTDLLNSQQQDE